MPRDPSPTTWAAYARALGVELQRRRIAAGLTQEDLAHRAGLTRTHYQQIERGSWTGDRPANPSLQSVARLLRQLDLEFSDVAPPLTAIQFDN